MVSRGLFFLTLDTRRGHRLGKVCVLREEAVAGMDRIGPGRLRSRDDPLTYRRILEAGKSVQAIGVRPEEIVPLLDAVGGKGMYILPNFAGTYAGPDQYEALLKAVEPYRG